VENHNEEPNILQKENIERINHTKFVNLLQTKTLIENVSKIRKIETSGKRALREFGIISIYSTKGICFSFAADGYFWVIECRISRVKKSTDLELKNGFNFDRLPNLACSSALRERVAEEVRL
jgi:hypothetical protein